MKIKKQRITIEELSHEDLVNLISTGITDGSMYLDILCPRKAYDALPDKAADDCAEDRCAKVLLAGGSVFVVDYDADGQAYGNLPHKVSEDDDVYYTVTLKDIIAGLERAACDEFTHCDDADGAAREREYLQEAFNEFSDEDSGGFDMNYADALWQIILFNELIYG